MKQQEHHCLLLLEVPAELELCSSRNSNRADISENSIRLVATGTHWGMGKTLTE